MTIDWRTAARLPAGELQTVLLEESDRLMSNLADEEEDAKLAVLAEPLRTIWLLSWLDFEVAQGSLLAYFLNSHGRHAELAIHALGKIGAVRMAEVITLAVRAQRTGGDMWRVRSEQLSQSGQSVVVGPYDGLPNADVLDELTDRYWEAADLDDWGNKLDAYLRDQAAVLAYQEP